MIKLFQDMVMKFISVNYLPLLLTFEFIYMISVHCLMKINKCLIFQNVSTLFLHVQNLKNNCLKTIITCVEVYINIVMLYTSTLVAVYNC